MLSYFHFTLPNWYALGGSLFFPSRNMANNVARGAGKQRVLRTQRASDWRSADGQQQATEMGSHLWVTSRTTLPERRHLAKTKTDKKQAKKKKTKQVGGDKLIIERIVILVILNGIFCCSFLGWSGFRGARSWRSPKQGGGRRRSRSEKDFTGLHPEARHPLTSHLHRRRRAARALGCTRRSTCQNWWPRKAAWTLPLCTPCACLQKVRRLLPSLSVFYFVVVGFCCVFFFCHWDLPLNRSRYSSQLNLHREHWTQCFCFFFLRRCHVSAVWNFQDAVAESWHQSYFPVLTPLQVSNPWRWLL